MECFQGPGFGPSALQTPREEGTLAISALQMKKLSPERLQLVISASGERLVSGGDWIGKQCGYESIITVAIKAFNRSAGLPLIKLILILA